MSIAGYKYFAANARACKMKSATTVEEIQEAMSPFSRDQEPEFWKYFERRAIRAEKKSLPLTNVETIAIERKKHTQIYNVSSAPTNTVSLYNRFYKTVVSKLTENTPGALLQEIKRRAVTWPYIDEHFDDFERYLRKRSVTADSPDHIERLFKYNNRRYVIPEDIGVIAGVRGQFVYYTNGEINEYTGALEMLVNKYPLNDSPSTPCGTQPSATAERGKPWSRPASNGIHRCAAGRYPVICYEVTGFDSSLLVSGIKTLVKARNGKINTHIFDRLMGDITMFQPEPINFNERISSWYSIFLDEYEITQFRNHRVNLKEVYNEFVSYCSSNKLETPGLNTYTSCVVQIEPNVSTGRIYGIRKRVNGITTNDVKEKIKDFINTNIEFTEVSSEYVKVFKDLLPLFKKSVPLLKNISVKDFKRNIALILGKSDVNNNEAVGKVVKYSNYDCIKGARLAKGYAAGRGSSGSSGSGGGNRPPTAAENAKWND